MWPFKQKKKVDMSHGSAIITWRFRKMSSIADSFPDARDEYSIYKDIQKSGVTTIDEYVLSGGLSGDELVMLASCKIRDILDFYDKAAK